MGLCFVLGCKIKMVQNKPKRYFQFSKNPLEVKHLFSYITIECKTHCCHQLQSTNRIAANPRISSYTLHGSEWESTSCWYQVWAIRKSDTNEGTDTFCHQR